MEYGVAILIEGSLDGRLELLTAKNSPLELSKHREDNHYTLGIKDPSIDLLFDYSNPDSEWLDQDTLPDYPEHQRAQSELGMQPGAVLSSANRHSWSIEKIKAVQQVLDYLVENQVACYMLVSDDEGDVKIEVTYNPARDARNHLSSTLDSEIKLLTE